MAGRTVWKYLISLDPLALQFTQVLSIREGAKLLHCAAQKGSIALWYEVPDPDAATESHGFQVFGTGNSPIGDHLTYVGSALFADGELVLHVYETNGGEGS